MLGDLEEKFYADEKNKSLSRAKLNYWYQVINYLRPFAIKKSTCYLNDYDMLQNYFKIGWRNLLKNKGYSFINIGGLAVGMAVAMLIGLWIQYEMNFDSFHENKDRIAMVMKHGLYSDEKQTTEVLPLPLYDELKNNYPEVKRATRLSWSLDRSFAVGEAKIKKSGRYVDPDFLHMFSFPLLKGNINTALKDPNSIILTESLASALFGSAEPMGQSIKIRNQKTGGLHDVSVTGILKNVPANSSIEFDFLAPYEFEIQTSQFLRNNLTNWANNSVMTIVELENGFLMEEFSKKISLLNMEKDHSIKNQTLFLHPVSKWHLYNDFKNWENAGGKIEYVYLFGTIGIFVLLIACINFMNLYTARSEKRAKEVGIRKVIGTQRRQLILQFFSESILTSFLAFLLSTAILCFSLPFLRQLGLEYIQVSLSSLSLLPIALAICVLTGCIAGIYPALYLSSFKPVQVLKGVIKQGKTPVTFRRVLVVSQFTVSIILIIGTVIIFQQINHAKERSLGYDPNNLISIPGSADLAKNYVALKQELLATGMVESVAKASSTMTTVFNQWGDFTWDDKDPDQNIALEAVMTEWDYEKTAGLRFKQGRPFSVEHTTDSNAVILNEAALKIIRYEEPIGRTIKRGTQAFTIVGVIEDVLLEDPFKSVEPLVILFNADAINVVLLRLKQPKNIQKVLTDIQPIFQKYNPASPFEYSFVKDDFNKKFAIENQVAKLGGIFSVLAIFISYLGLFGLASYISEQRTKEIGIRKILGASTSSIWQMLSKDFVLLIAVSCFIAFPMAYYYMHDWLQKYDYRIEISWWPFAATGLVALVITLLTVSFQAVKAAIWNPVNSLRSM